MFLTTGRDTDDSRLHVCPSEAHLGRYNSNPSRGSCDGVNTKCNHDYDSFFTGYDAYTCNLCADEFTFCGKTDGCDDDEFTTTPCSSLPYCHSFGGEDNTLSRDICRCIPGSANFGLDYDDSDFDPDVCQGLVSCSYSQEFGRVCVRDDDEDRSIEDDRRRLFDVLYHFDCPVLGDSISAVGQSLDVTTYSDDGDNKPLISAICEYDVNRFDCPHTHPVGALESWDIDLVYQSLASFVGNIFSLSCHYRYPFEIVY